MKCNRCGKENVDPVYPHTCTPPLALKLADEITETPWPETYVSAVASELRRLHQSEGEGWRYSDELEQERKRLTAENEALRKTLRRLIEVSAHLDACQATVGHARAALARAGEVK